ncbi:MAG TPA: MerR family transcriptional regulator [Aeromonadales bacterium]|nr:MerR family transcriptional regulator [Aeromonadales bacterium]
MTTNEIMQGLLLNDVNTLTLVEISRACTTNAEWVLTLVEEGIIEPISTQELSTDDINEMNSSTLVFPGSCLERAQTVRRLQRDLSINLPGAALVLELMDELERLRSHIKVLES